MSQPSIIDSNLFDPTAIESETADFVERVEKELSAAPPLYKFEPQAIREARAAGFSIFGPIKHRDEAQDRRGSGSQGSGPGRRYSHSRIHSG
jgi:hypothetical protein